MKGPLIEGLYSEKKDGYINKFNRYEVRFKFCVDV